MSGHANQNLVAIRKKFLLSGVRSEYKDLAKFAEDTDFHLFGEELEDSLKKAKGRHYSLQPLKPNPLSMVQLSESSMKPQKMTGQPKDPPHKKVSQDLTKKSKI